MLAEKEMAAHSSILAWRIPWTEESGGFIGSQRVGHDLVTTPPPPLPLCVRQWFLKHNTKTTSN